LVWASGCRLRGCCVGVPLSWCVHWAPVLAFRHSLSVTSQSPIRPVLSWRVCWAPVLAFHHSSSITSRSPIRPVPLAPSFHHSRPCCSVGGAVVVVVIVVVVPSLSPSPIPHCSHLRPCCCALVASPWPSLLSSFSSSPRHLLLVLTSSSSYSLSLSLSSVCFRGCDVAGGAYLVRGCCVLPTSLPRHLRSAVSTHDQPHKQ